MVIHMDRVYHSLYFPIPTILSHPISPFAHILLTSHMNSLFERGAAIVGLDFMSHPFWDKYIEFEERNESRDRIFGILARVIHIPMHQYSRYFEHYRLLAQSQPLTELASVETLTAFRAGFEASSEGTKSEAEIEHNLRLRLDRNHLEIFANTGLETNKRWAYESEIKRPYFHVTELDQSQLINWNKYLDFEEAEGSFARTQFLYERALVTCAHYDEFWFRYARWMAAQPDKQEDLRIIYQRAAYLYVPIANPAIRLHYAYFEEMSGRVDVAKDIHDAILVDLPSHVKTIVSLANLRRRHEGLEAAIEVYKTYMNSPQCDMSTKATLVAEWARLLWKIEGSAVEARVVFQANQQYYTDSRQFWRSYLVFEIEQPTSKGTDSVQHDRIKQIISHIRSKSTLPVEVVKELVQLYMAYLLERGTTDTAKEYMTLDREVNGPASVARARTGSSAAVFAIPAAIHPPQVPIQQQAYEDPSAHAYAYFQTNAGSA